MPLHRRHSSIGSHQLSRDDSFIEVTNPSQSGTFDSRHSNSVLNEFVSQATVFRVDQ